MINTLKKVFGKKRAVEPNYTDSVDFDRESVPIGGNDATSLLFALSMKGYTCHMVAQYDGSWVVNVGSHTFAGETQREALLKAIDHMP